MKKSLSFTATAIMLVLFPSLSSGQALSAEDVVRKADEKFNGEKSSYSVMTMTIIRPAWQRSVQFRNWSLGKDFALTLITAPARDAGETFLKRKSEMWSFNPVINRLIKFPPSMMSQGWMGSDYTNDDIMKESSVVKDYSHSFAGEEVIGGRSCYRIKMVAKENAPVIWGHQVRWIDKQDLLVMKAEYFDEEGILVRTETGTVIKEIDGRLVPSRLEIQPADEPGNKTVVVIEEMKFNIALQESFFSQQNMKNIH
jgi:outer membrane lipoprotein-sorting protein